MPSDIMHTHVSQLVVVAYRHCTVLQSTDIRNDGKTKPAWGILVELVLVEIYLVPDFEIQVLRGHRGSCVHGSAKSCCGRAFDHRLDTHLSKPTGITYEPWQGLRCTVGLRDLINAG